MTRVNYNTDVGILTQKREQERRKWGKRESRKELNRNDSIEIMNSFGVAVSAIGSGDSVYGVQEGNKFICSNLVSTAKVS
jgi:hypothetical protein